MKRALLVILVILIALGGYFWYRGDAKTWLASLKTSLFPRKDGVGFTEAAGGKENEVGLTHTTAALPYRAALTSINEAPLAKDRVRAWDEAALAYSKNVPGARDDVVTPIEAFVKKYVLSSRMPDDPGIAIRHHVTRGDNLASIAKKNGTTIEAIKRLNGIKGDVIRPGISFKVLNQPVAVYIDKSDFTLWVTYSKKLLLVMSCGIGQNNRTTAGKIKIVERIKDPVWYPADGPSVPSGDPNNLLGSRWLGFQDVGDFTGLGIHEAVNEADVRSESSNGCIRLTKEDVEFLFDIVPIGTSVTIFE